jgi:hypothetical protein
MQYRSLTDRELSRMARDAADKSEGTTTSVSSELLNELADRFELLVLSAVRSGNPASTEPHPDQLKLF